MKSHFAGGFLAGLVLCGLNFWCFPSISRRPHPTSRSRKRRRAPKPGGLLLGHVRSWPGRLGDGNLVTCALSGQNKNGVFRRALGSRHRGRGRSMQVLQGGGHPGHASKGLLAKTGQGPTQPRFRPLRKMNPEGSKGQQIHYIRTRFMTGFVRCAWPLVVRALLDPSSATDLMRREWVDCGFSLLFGPPRGPAPPCGWRRDPGTNTWFVALSRCVAPELSAGFHENTLLRPATQFFRVPLPDFFVV